MRKDVRMGFAVGGVLLAVIIVAVLFFHHNKNGGKAVAFDAADGGKNAVSAGPIDTGAPDPSARTGDAGGPAAAPTPIDSHPLTPASSSDKGDAKAGAGAGAADPADKGDKWDMLFSSSAADPIRAQLTNDSKPKGKSKKHKADAAPAAAAPSMDVPSLSATADAGAANVPVDAGTNAPATGHAPVMIASAAPEPPAKESARTHRIEPGETFVSIARAVYGDGKYFQAIVDANPNVDPAKLKPGTMIQLPPASQVKEAKKSRSSSSATSGGSASSGPALSTDGKSYTVQKNDNLYKIARKLYGNGEKGEEIYAANKQLIGPDSTRLKIGMVLSLPETPSVR